MKRRALLMGGVTLASLAVIGSRREAPRGRNWSTLPARDVIRNHYFPNVALVTHENRTVRFYDDLIKGKIVTINFFQTICPDVCPLITVNLVQVQKLLGSRVGRDIFMYSITLTPEADTPAVLKTYAEDFHVGPGWLFLTGKPADVELLRRRLGFVNLARKLDKTVTGHIGNVRYGNEPLQLWGACPGTTEPSYMVESIAWVDRPKIS